MTFPDHQSKFMRISNHHYIQGHIVLGLRGA